MPSAREQQKRGAPCAPFIFCSALRVSIASGARHPLNVAPTNSDRHRSQMRSTHILAPPCLGDNRLLGSGPVQGIQRMWPFSLLKKLSQDPAVGQTRGDYIGCYLLGTQTTGREDDISYISLATTRAQLEQDARQYLQDFLQQHPQLAATERDTLQDLLQHWNTRVDAHLAVADKPKHPLAVQGGSELFLRTGMRARKKEKGRYLE